MKGSLGDGWRGVSGNRRPFSSGINRIGAFLEYWYSCRRLFLSEAVTARMVLFHGFSVRVLCSALFFIVLGNISDAARGCEDSMETPGV